MNTPSVVQQLEALIHDYQRLVFHTIYGLTSDWEESQDLTQDTFHQALRGLEAARASSGEQFNAKAWLLRIALNTVRMQRRRRAVFRFIPFSRMQEERQQETETDEAINLQALSVQPGGYGSSGNVDPAELIAEQDAVHRTMAQLPAQFRECLLLSIVAGLSPTEIAELLSLKEPAVRQRLSRARKQFQQFYLQESGETLSEPAGAVGTQTAKVRKQKRSLSSALTDRTHQLTLTVQP